MVRLPPVGQREPAKLVVALPYDGETFAQLPAAIAAPSIVISTLMSTALDQSVALPVVAGAALCRAMI